MDCPNIKLNKEIVEYINKFNTDEELLRSGGLPTEMLDRLAFGFSDEDVKTINPDQLNVKWHDDMDNVKWEQQKSGLSKVAWAKTINLSEPIDVVFEKNKFYIDDGHHRSYAAKILKQPLNVNLVIKMNPIVALTPKLGYDDFHRCLFKQIKNTNLNESINPSEATNDWNALQTVIQGKRNLAFIVRKGGFYNNHTIQQLYDLIKDNDLAIMDVAHSQFKPFIAYRKQAYYQAQKLRDIAEKHGGFLPSRNNIEDTYEIGKLLEYDEDEIWNHLYINYHKKEVDMFKNNLSSRDYALNEQISRIKEVMGIKPINEYITQDEVYLRNYFNMTDEQKKSGLPYEYPWFFKDFLVEYDIDFDMPTHAFIGSDGEESGDEYDDYEIPDWLAQNNKPLFDKFADYLYDRISDHELNIPDAEYPAWSFFSEGKLVKNQWLIHFTNNPWSIAKNGFTRGVSEIEKLGLTTHLGEFDKKYGGYNFAFRAEIYHRYAKGRHGYKYGDEAVMFIGSGIEAYHYGDEEPQVIFFGKNAKYIVPITKEYDDYAVHNLKSGGIIYKSQDLDDVVSWVMRNYQQYQNKINYEPQRVKK